MQTFGIEILRWIKPISLFIKDMILLIIFIIIYLF